MSLLFPELALLFLALFVLGADWALPKEKKRIAGYLAFGGVFLIFLGIQAAVKTHFLPDAGNLFFHFSSGQPEFQGFVSDSFSLFFKELFLLVLLAVFVYSFLFWKKESENQGACYSLFLFSTLGAFLLTGAMDLLVLFVSFELMSIPLYLLSGFQKRDVRSSEAGFKYFLMGAVTSALLVYGISLVYASTGTTDLRQMTSPLGITLTQILQNRALLLGLFFLLSVFAFKIAAVPFHMWAPDVYEGAPVPVVSFLAIVPKLAVLGFLLRIFLTNLSAANPFWIWIFSILSALSMTVGNLMALHQRNLKRLLAYSGISQMGYILLGFCSLLPVSTALPALQNGYQAILFYLIAYTVADLTAFGVITYLSSCGRETVESCRGLGERSPGIAFLLVISLLSLAGLPPFLGFVGKFFIFAAAFTRGWFRLVALGVVNSVISLFYYLRVAKAVYYEASEVSDSSLARHERASNIPPKAVYLEKGNQERLPGLPFSMKAALWTLGLCLISFGVFPHLLIRTAETALTKFLVGF